MWQVASLLVISSIMICGPNILSNAQPLKGVNVRTANRREFPFIVAIARYYGSSQSDNYACAGTLISDKHVITAAHCVENYLETDLYVLVGCEHLDSCHHYDIDLWEVYDTWALQNDINRRYIDKNDIAVLKLVQSVIHPSVVPAILPSRRFIMPYESNVQLAGWGKSNMGYPLLLQTATVKLTSRANCNWQMESFPTFEPLDEREFCTLADPYVVLGCGDSGGPVVYNGSIILGVNEDGCVNVPLHRQINIHIHINYFRDFIEDLLAKKY